MQSRTGVIRVRRLEKEENVRTLVKKNDSQVMNEKRCERPVRSKDTEDAVRARQERIRRKRENYRNFDKKKTLLY
jgi:hypothetical protein